MAKKTYASSSLALFLILNILFFTHVSARKIRCKHIGRSDGRDGFNGRSSRPRGPGGFEDWQRGPGGLGRGFEDWQRGPGGLGRGPGYGDWQRGQDRLGRGSGDWEREPGDSRDRLGDKSRDEPERGGSTPPTPTNGSAPITQPGGSTPSGTSCPREAMKFAVCSNVLNGLQNVTSGQQPPCCSVLEGLVDLEAATCLCTALKSNVLGVNRDIPTSLSFILNVCSRQVPTGFQCA